MNPSQHSSFLGASTIHTQRFASRLSLLQHALVFALPALFIVTLFGGGHFVANRRSRVEGVEWIGRVRICYPWRLRCRFKVDQ